MRGTIRIVAILLLAGGATLAFGTLALWTAAGAHTGWSKTYIEIEKTDEVTGITYPERINRFVPGVDFLFPGLAAASVCIFAGVVILKRNSNKKP